MILRILATTSERMQSDSNEWQGDRSKVRGLVDMTIRTTRSERKWEMLMFFLVGLSLRISLSSRMYEWHTRAIMLMYWFDIGCSVVLYASISMNGSRWKRRNTFQQTYWQTLRKWRTNDTISKRKYMQKYPENSRRSGHKSVPLLWSRVIHSLPSPSESHRARAKKGFRKEEWPHVN